MISNKVIPLFKVFMSPEVIPELTKVLHSGFIGEGEAVVRFESLLANYVGNQNLATLNSGTSALHLAYHMILNNHKNDLGHNSRLSADIPEIISTPMTCTATNVPIIANHARIVWADVDPVTGNIDPVSIKEKITKNTKAITMVHWGGTPCKIDEINQIAAEHNIKVVEDAAHALGAFYKGKPIGSHSDFTAFSFQAIKHLTSVDGGLLTSKNDIDIKRARLLRWFGIDRTIREGIDLRCELDVEEAGYKFHMNDVNATVGIENLKHLDFILKKHRSNASFFDNAFNNIGSIKVAKADNCSISSFWLYTIHVENRDNFIKKMAEDGIGVSKVHSRNDTHTMFQASKAYLPNVHEFNRTHVCIPVGWWLSEQEKEYIAEKTIKHSIISNSTLTYSKINEEVF